MIYDNAIDQAKGAKQSAAIVFHIAKVTTVSGDKRASVQFYGENAASTKLYPYIEGYLPVVGDDVLMASQGSTYIIIGKISKDSNTNWHLTKAEADDYYEPKGQTYTTDRLTSGTEEVILDAKVLYPKENGTYYLGRSSNKFKEVYSKTVDAEEVDASTGFTGPWGYGFSSNQRNLSWLNASTIVPSYDEGVSLGTSSRKFLEAYIKNYYFGRLYLNSNRYLAPQSGSTNTLIPDTTNAINLGASGIQFNNIYAKQFYQNGTAISTSDKRKKTGIKGITKKYIDFFRKLRPVLFKFKDGESGRLHSGFIAQEVEEAAQAAGIENKDLAFLCIDENGDYGLRYEELIAIQTQVIQDLLVRVEELEKKLK